MKKNAHTVESAISYYMEVMDLGESSLRSYAAVRARLAKSSIFKTELTAFTPAMLRQFLNKQTDLEASTLFHVYYVKIKGTIHRYIKDHNLQLSLNLDGLLKPPPLEEDLEGEEQHLTLAELAKLSLIDLSDKPRAHLAREIFLLMCYSGMAIGDVVEFNPVTAISKDRKWFHYRRMKTKKKCTVPLLPMLERVIARNEWPVKVKWRMLTYYMEDVARLVGRKITPHSGRHTFGSIMLELGFSMEAVSKMMGHGSIQTTERHYAKVTKDKIAREWQEIPERIKQLMNNEI